MQFLPTPKLNQTLSLVLRNLSNMFVCDAVVLASVIFSFDTIWKICYFTQTPEEYCMGVVALCERVFLLQKSTALKVVSYVNDVMCAGVGATLVHRFQQIMKSKLAGKVKLIITYFLLLLFV